jgi:hypothetical protein
MTNKTLSAAFLMFCIALPLLTCSKSKETDQKAESVKKAEQAEKATGPFEVNACSLVTQQEAEELLNEKLAAPREEQHLEGESTRAAMSSCLFPSESQKSLSIFYRKSPIADNSPESIQAIKNTVSGEGSSLEEVDGVGNTAFWSNNQLHVFEGDRSYLIITVDGLPDEEQSSEAAKKAAEIALDRV